MVKNKRKITYFPKWNIQVLLEYSLKPIIILHFFDEFLTYFFTE